MWQLASTPVESAALLSHFSSFFMVCNVITIRSTVSSGHIQNHEKSQCISAQETFCCVLRMQRAAASHVKICLFNDSLFFCELVFVLMLPFWLALLLDLPVLNEKIPSACPTLKALYVCRFLHCFLYPPPLSLLNLLNSLLRRDWKTSQLSQL